MSGAGIIALFAVAFALWAGTLAMIWQAFRSWQYLADLSAAQAGLGGESWEDLPRSQVMGLRAQIFLRGLPEGCAEDMAPYARRFRRAVAGIILLSLGISALVFALEPALGGAVRVFLIGFGLWLALHLVMLGRWRKSGARA